MASAKSLIFAELAEIAGTIGHPLRLELIEQVSQGERSVERLSVLIGQSMANTSQHLKHLRRSGFVQSRRDGKRVLYRLGDGPVVPLLTALRHYAEHSRAAVRDIVSDYLHRLDRLEPISREDLVARLREDNITVLDVRPKEEFDLGRIPGAVNVPLDEIEKRLSELPLETEIVAYCRGPYCVLSFEAVATLREKGYRVRRLEDGFPEWLDAGLSVEYKIPVPPSPM
ncbi:metalloregulator ArsR/SmtB family transcription factor [Agrobacterium genomosp. 3 str. CIP 111-78]|uniref:Metalloregulator ArsR/SmtB family transcription factor n=1 Tax=Agrobacterium tumefaciens TaxID=358 RepID=A0AAE6ENN5_AGRTU|nr:MULTISPECIES: metalloregulator ArsR/SmtB family transcription factor [Agrobacterium]KNY31754.1 ArsR family transcriptional regulator [Agrobacterium sp. SUL3]MCA2372678.1 metalloregulator ArsR/SmtB family transcription factor [Agrobacterium tomkonis CIP 111-78]QCM03826.1 metalloregulator ArsR/SmtB family transcription factor [Agrobacterium tumefaciens]